MQIRRARRKPMSMELSPLIDCMFQLLVFFMLSSTFLAPSLGLDLPQAGAAAAPDARQPIIISLDTQGRIFLNRREITREALHVELRTALAASEHRSVTIRGDEEVSYQRIIAVLDAAKACGARHIDLACDSP